MEYQFELLAITRQNILNEIEDCSINQLFEIPERFNNHIIWNAVHVVVTQQLLIYGNTATPFRIAPAIIENYRKGTTPTSDVKTDMIDFVKTQLIGSVASLKEDYNNAVFGPYKQVTTSYNATITSVEEAISFVNLHDSMHYGQIKMLKKFL
jgi:hypothetical protein